MKMIDHMGKRLATAMHDKGVDKNAVAKEFGVKVPSVYDWLEHGRIAKKHIPKLESYFEKPLGWWLGLDDNPNAFNTTPTVSRAKPQTTDEIIIEQCDTGCCVGDCLVLQGSHGTIKSWHVDSEWLKSNVRSYSSAKNLCIVTGFGDSMLGMFNPGDPLLVDHGITVCDHDGVYFFRIGNEGFIKRLQRIPAQGVLVLSESPKYRDWMITPDMDFHVLGKVLTVWKSEQF